VSRVPRSVERAIEALHLPAMPQILLRFYEEADSDTASVDRLAELVLRDPALSARILTVANSAAFRRAGELRSIRESLLALGTRMVRTLASCILVQSTFQRVAGAEARDLAGFWRHSLLVAELARGTAIELDAAGPEAEEAYLAGLLHDVGQLLLLGGLGEPYADILAQGEGESDLSSRERLALPTDHGAVGAWLVDQWQMPSLMADAIQFHHLEPAKVAGLDRLGRILWSAHVLATQETASEAEREAVQRLLGFDAERLGLLRDEGLRKVEALALALGPDVAQAPAAQTVPRVPRPPAKAAEDEGPRDAMGAGLQAAVSTMAALQALPRDVATLSSEVDLLLCVQEAARILFGIQRMAFFFVKPGRPALSAIGLGDGPGALQRLEIPLQPDICLCADAALTRRPLATLDLDGSQMAPAMDRQVAHALGAEGLMYVPMLAQGTLVGVMALAISSVQRATLTSQTGRLWDFAGSVAGNLVALRHVHEREKQVEAEVAARFRLQGRRVAHEVNNPLAIIRNYLTIISNDAKPGESGGASQADIEVLREEIERLSAIVRVLSTDQPDTRVEPPGTVDVNRLLEGLRTLYEAALFGAAQVRLELHLAAAPALVRAERDPLKQIVFNLWKNAAEAMQPGGVVVTEVTPDVDQNGVRYVQVRIRDTGPGLPAEVQASLYRPLPAGAPPPPPGRAGLGLSIVLGLVQRSGGFITCQTGPVDGTTFTLLFPQSQRTDR